MLYDHPGATGVPNINVPITDYNAFAHCLQIEPAALIQSMLFDCSDVVAPVKAAKHHPKLVNSTFRA
jgi:hypothetical protein